MTATDQDITEGNKQDAQEFEGLQPPLSVSCRIFASRN